ARGITLAARIYDQTKLAELFASIPFHRSILEALRESGSPAAAEERTYQLLYLNENGEGSSLADLTAQIASNFVWLTELEDELNKNVSWREPPLESITPPPLMALRPKGVAEPEVHLLPLPGFASKSEQYTLFEGKSISDEQRYSYMRFLVAIAHYDEQGPGQ